MVTPDSNPALELRCYRQPYETVKRRLCGLLAAVMMAGAWSGEGFLISQLGPHRPTVAWASLQHPSARAQADRQQLVQAVRVLKRQFGGRVPSNSEMYWALTSRYPTQAIGTAISGPAAAAGNQLVDVNNGRPAKPVLYAPGGGVAVEAHIGPHWAVSYQLHESARPHWSLELLGLIVLIIATPFVISSWSGRWLSPRLRFKRSEIRRADQQTWEQLVDSSLAGAEKPIEGFSLIRVHAYRGVYSDNTSNEKTPVLALTFQSLSYSSGEWHADDWGNELDESGEITQGSRGRYWHDKLENVHEIEAKCQQMIDEAQSVNSRRLRRPYAQLPDGSLVSSARELAALLPDPQQVKQLA